MTTGNKGRRKWLRSELIQIGIIVLSMLVFRSSLADHYHVPSGSMEYTLMPGDRVVVDKTAYGLRVPFTTIDIVGAASPERGEVAVFDSPRDGKRLIKRIVAVGGDEVRLVGGHLWINGEPLGDGRVEHFHDRDALLNLDAGGGPDIGAMTVPQGQVLAIGDHRGNSLDGRYFGLFPETELVGRAIAVYYRRGDGFVWKPL